MRTLVLAAILVLVSACNPEPIVIHAPPTPTPAPVWSEDNAAYIADVTTTLVQFKADLASLYVYLPPKNETVDEINARGETALVTWEKANAIAEPLSPALYPVHTAMRKALTECEPKIQMLTPSRWICSEALFLVDMEIARAIAASGAYPPPPDIAQ